MLLNNAWLLARIPTLLRGRGASGIFLGQFSRGLIGPMLVAAGSLHFVYLTMGLVAAALSAILIVVSLRSRLIRPITIRTAASPSHCKEPSYVHAKPSTPCRQPSRS